MVVCYSRLLNTFRSPYNALKQVHKRTFRKITSENRGPLIKPGVAEYSVSGKSLLKAGAFTVGSVCFFYAGATIWQYENVRQLTMRTPPFNWVDQKRSQSHQKAGEIRQMLHNWWVTQSEGQKVAWGLIAVNSAVFVLWRIPQLTGFMTRYFASNPSSKSICLPMFLSTFSHYSLIHLACNMFVLHSFSSGAVHFLGKEQFMAMYLSAGVVSSFTSYLHKAVTRQAGMSLGASGAIMAAIAAVCVQYPDSRLALVFLPVFTFTAGSALKAILVFDTAGMFLGWKFLDHAAHLGGSLFGIAYVMYGQQFWQQHRGRLMKWWHSVRETKRDK